MAPSTLSADQVDALLERMFSVEFSFMSDPSASADRLSEAFHPDVVVHEPLSLPYAGDWRGLDGVSALIREMGACWSEMALNERIAFGGGDTILLAGQIELTARANGQRVVQPFAEHLRFLDGRLIEGTPFYHDTAALLQALKD